MSETNKIAAMGLLIQRMRLIEAKCTALMKSLGTVAVSVEAVIVTVVDFSIPMIRPLCGLLVDTSLRKRNTFRITICQISTAKPVGYGCL